MSYKIRAYHVLRLEERARERSDGVEEGQMGGRGQMEIKIC